MDNRGLTSCTCMILQCLRLTKWASTSAPPKLKKIIKNIPVIKTPYTPTIKVISMAFVTTLFYTACTFVYFSYAINGFNWITSEKCPSNLFCFESTYFLPLSYKLNEDKFVEVLIRRIEYTIEPSSKTIIFLVPGGPGASIDSLNNVPIELMNQTIADEDFTFVLVEHRFGGSKPMNVVSNSHSVFGTKETMELAKENISSELVARDLLEIMKIFQQQHFFSHFHIIGGSYGATVVKKALSIFADVKYNYRDYIKLRGVILSGTRSEQFSFSKSSKVDWDQDAIRYSIENCLSNMFCRSKIGELLPTSSDLLEDFLNLFSIEFKNNLCLELIENMFEKRSKYVLQHVLNLIFRNDPENPSSGIILAFQLLYNTIKCSDVVNYRDNFILNPTVWQYFSKLYQFFPSSFADPASNINFFVYSNITQTEGFFSGYDFDSCHKFYSNSIYYPCIKLNSAAFKNSQRIHSPRRPPKTALKEIRVLIINGLLDFSVPISSGRKFVEEFKKEFPLLVPTMKVYELKNYGHRQLYLEEPGIYLLAEYFNIFEDFQTVNDFNQLTLDWRQRSSCIGRFWNTNIKIAKCVAQKPKPLNDKFINY